MTGASNHRGARIRGFGFCLPGEPVIRNGPYRYLRHPNYLAVAVEIFALPMVVAMRSPSVSSVAMPPKFMS